MEEVEKNVNEVKTVVKEVDLTYDFIGSFDTKRADDFLYEAKKNNKNVIKVDN